MVWHGMLYFMPYQIDFFGQATVFLFPAPGEDHCHWWVGIMVRSWRTNRVALWQNLESRWVTCWFFGHEFAISSSKSSTPWWVSKQVGVCRTCRIPSENHPGLGKNLDYPCVWIVHLSTRWQVEDVEGRSWTNPILPSVQQVVLFVEFGEIYDRIQPLQDLKSLWFPSVSCSTVFPLRCPRRDQIRLEPKFRMSHPALRLVSRGIL